MFREQILRVNLLYLGCRVLILLDLSYLSRFWTQLEAWLSMQAVTEHGLAPVSESDRRFAIKRLYDKHSICEELLINMWLHTSPSQAYETLNKPDVEVTSKKDKDAQLPKIKALHEEAKIGHYLYIHEPVSHEDDDDEEDEDSGWRVSAAWKGSSRASKVESTAAGAPAALPNAQAWRTRFFLSRTPTSPRLQKVESRSRLLPLPACPPSEFPSSSVKIVEQHHDQDGTDWARQRMLAAARQRSQQRHIQKTESPRELPPASQV